MTSHCVGLPEHNDRSAYLYTMAMPLHLLSWGGGVTPLVSGMGLRHSLSGTDPKNLEIFK